MSTTSLKSVSRRKRKKTQKRKRSSDDCYDDNDGPDCVFILGNDHQNVKTKTSVTFGRDPDTISMEHNKIIEGGRSSTAKAANTWKLLSIITVPPDKQSNVSIQTIITHIENHRGMSKRIKAASDISKQNGLYFFVDKIVLDPEYFTLPELQERYKQNEPIRISILEHMKSKLRDSH